MVFEKIVYFQFVLYTIQIVYKYLNITKICDIHILLWYLWYSNSFYCKFFSAWLAIFWERFFFSSFLVLVLPISVCMFENICFIYFNALFLSLSFLTSWWNVSFINIYYLSSTLLILWLCIQFCQRYLFSKTIFMFIAVIWHVFVHQFIFTFPRHKHTCCDATALDPGFLVFTSRCGVLHWSTTTGDQCSLAKTHLLF